MPALQNHQLSEVYSEDTEKHEGAGREERDRED
jgi:hypothetical protein